MKEIITWIIVSGLIFISFLTILIVGLAKRRRKLIIISITLFVLLIVTSGWTLYIFGSKSYNKVTKTLKPRTGEEIYISLFGKTNNKCVNILDHQDQVIPKIDYAIWLHFETCPEELKRILQLHTFQFKKQSTKGWQTDGPSSNEKWFKPESLGDSVLVFEYKKDEYGNGQTIYSSFDSTRVFCIDVLD